MRKDLEHEYSGVVRVSDLLERLDGKPSRAVLRGRRVSDDLLLPDLVSYLRQHLGGDSHTERLFGHNSQYEITYRTVCNFI